jgi:hypothetical protein
VLPIVSAVGNAPNTEQEAQDMIDILGAYWKVVLKRLIDNMEQIIDQELVRSLPELCNLELRQRVAVANDSEMLDLFSVPSFEEQRQQLQAKFIRLTTAKGKYEQLAVGSAQVQSNEKKQKTCSDSSCNETPTKFGFDVDPSSAMSISIDSSSL